MNKQGPGKIDYCDFTSNPISGCKHNCSYCYLKRQLWRRPNIFDPTWNENEYRKLLSRKKPCVIFMGDAGDMFGKWVPNEQIEDIIINIFMKKPQITFLLLTKNPGRYSCYTFPMNVWIGTTFDGLPFTRRNIKKLSRHTHVNKWISFEPLKSQPTGIDLEFVRKIQWIVIGADSNRGVERPPISWGMRIIRFAEICNIPVFVKDNWPELPRIKQTPWKLRNEP